MFNISGKTHVHIEQSLLKDRAAEPREYLKQEVIGRIISFDISENTITIQPILIKDGKVDNSAEWTRFNIFYFDQLVFFIGKSHKIIRYLNEDELTLEFFDLLL